MTRREGGQNYFLDKWRVDDIGQGLDFIREPAALPAYVTALLGTRFGEQELDSDFLIPEGTSRVTLFVIDGLSG